MRKYLRFDIDEVENQLSDLQEALNVAITENLLTKEMCKDVHKESTCWGIYCRLNGIKDIINTVCPSVLDRERRHS